MPRMPCQVHTPAGSAHHVWCLIQLVHEPLGLAGPFQVASVTVLQQHIAQKLRLLHQKVKMSAHPIVGHATLFAQRAEF